MFDVKSKDIIEIVLKKLGLFYKINKTQIPNLCKLSLIANSTNDVIGYSLFQTNPSDQKVTIHAVIIKKLLLDDLVLSSKLSRDVLLVPLKKIISLITYRIGNSQTDDLLKKIHPWIKLFLDQNSET